MIGFTCTQLVNGQCRASGIEVGTVVSERFSTFQVNQLGNFMRIIIAGQAQGVAAFHYQAV
ncbi:hypothetical protein D3C76_1616720 [compost metagenome]